MAEYKPRQTKPESNDKRYINYSKGGYNTCVPIDSTGFVMPNCVGYCQGRMLEMENENAINWKLPAANAEDWLDIAKANGYKTGTDARLGAIIVWSKGNKKNSADGCGHVACVEHIYDDGTILISESAYDGYIFKTEKVAKPYSREGYAFEGFIYPKTDFGTGLKEAEAKTVEKDRYIVFKDGVRKNSYKSKTYAIAYSDTIDGIVYDIEVGQIIHPIKRKINEKSHPNLKVGCYRVRKRYNDESSSAGSFQIWKSAYKRWLQYSPYGYHIYDTKGNQLD